MDVAYIVDTFWLALQGVTVTLWITVVALLGSLLPAFLFALGRIYQIKIVKEVALVYTALIRATPPILLILICYSFLPSMLNVFLKSIGSSIDVFQMNPLIYAYVIFIFTTTGSMSELIRSALMTVDRGQFEAASAIGLTAFQAYTRIIIPQALRSALPNLCNLTIGIVKGTSLVFVMTIKDITAIAKIEAAYGYKYTESYLVIFLIYFLLCSLIQLLFKAAEKQLQTASVKKKRRVAYVESNEYS